MNEIEAPRDYEGGDASRISNLTGVPFIFELVRDGTLNQLKEIYNRECRNPTGLFNLRLNNGKGETLAMVAVAAGKPVEMIDFLLSYCGVDINAASTSEFGGTLLHTAVRHSPNLIPHLVRYHGVNLDKIDDQGATPLLLCAVCRRPAAARALLEAGADPTIPDLLGANCLFLACQELIPDNAEMVSLLLDYAPELYNTTCAVIAAYSARWDLLLEFHRRKFRLDVEDFEYHATPALMAAQIGDYQVLKWLKETVGVSLTAEVGPEKRTPLETAANMDRIHSVWYLRCIGIGPPLPTAPDQLRVHPNAWAYFPDLTTLERQNGRKWVLAHLQEIPHSIVSSADAASLPQLLLRPVFTDRAHLLCPETVVFVETLKKHRTQNNLKPKKKRITFNALKEDKNQVKSLIRRGRPKGTIKLKQLVKDTTDDEDNVSSAPGKKPKR